MGFGNIITTGLSIAILLIAGYMILAGLSFTLNTAAASTAAVRELKAGQIDTALAISNVSQVDAVTLEFNVTNTGSAPINNISRMDVILKYVDPATGDTLTGLWLTPAKRDSPIGGAGKWYGSGVASTMRDTTNTAMLLPGETLTIRGVLLALPPSDTGVIVVSAPNGADASRPFTFGAGVI